MQIHYNLGQTAAKKGNLATFNSEAHIKQKRCLICVAGQNDSSALDIASSESCQPNRNLFGTEAKLKKVYSKAKIKSIPTEHGFGQNNGSERGQTKDWYPNKKMVVVPVCLNDRCCFLECVGIVLY